MEEDMLCSVIVPAYDCADSLAQSVGTVLAQTYRNLEVLIVDDCSTDDTRAVMAQLAEADGRVRCFSQPSNRGVAEARNRAFAEARGRFCAFLDSDDLWVPDKLETMIGLLRESDADFGYSSYSFIDGEGNSFGPEKIVPSSCSLSALLRENYILCSSVVMDASLCKRFSMDGTYAHEDLVYWLALLQAGCTAVGCPRVLVRYRVHERNRSGNKAKAAKDRWIVYRRFLGYPVAKSLFFFFCYAVNGVCKYRKLR
jgi:teichuronic acid biosynthesis glycosyltransferase TuaG